MPKTQIIPPSKSVPKEVNPIKTVKPTHTPPVMAVRHPNKPSPK